MPQQFLADPADAGGEVYEELVVLECDVAVGTVIKSGGLKKWVLESIESRYSICNQEALAFLILSPSYELVP